MDTFSKLKHRLSSKQRLRYIKNSFQDDLESIKHRIKQDRSSGQHTQKPIPKLSESEKKNKHREIIELNNLQMELHNFHGKEPLISIIIFNRCSRGLLENFNETTGYNNYEIFLVGNENEGLYEEFKEFLNLKPVKDGGNEILNQTVNAANGEYVLFLNGQIETTSGWLNLMVKASLESNAAITGSKLIYGNINGYNGNDYSYRLMSSGIGFKLGHDGCYEPYYFDEGQEPVITGLRSAEPRAAVSINSLLIKKERFQAVKGFLDIPSPYKEADLCLKIHENGHNIVYNPNSILIIEDSNGLHDNDPKFKDSNFQKTFKSRWQNYLNKNVILDKLDGTKIFSKKPLKLTFMVTEKGNRASAGDYFTALEFGEFLEKLGWEIDYLSRNGPEYWYEVDSSVDVIISLLDVYDPRRIKSSNQSIIKVGWPRNWFDRWVSHPGFTNYDIILTPSKTSYRYIEENNGIKPFIMPLATNSDRFNMHISPKEEYICDYCFTGSYWNYTREIEQMLDPETLPYNFKLYGKNWDKSEKFKEYYHGFVNYSSLPEIYASTRLVIDDANNATKRYGSINSRVYDAIAAGTMVITNGAIGAEEIFKGELPVFSSKNELNGLIRNYLENEEERLLKVKKLQKIVLENHSYGNRALALKKILKDHIKSMLS